MSLKKIFEKPIDIQTGTCYNKIVKRKDTSQTRKAKSMKNIVKRFIEIYRLDMEGRRGEWEVTNETYDEAVATMDGWNDAVREVEKTFHPDTFEITERTIRETRKDYEGRWTWNGKTKTTIY